LPDKDTAVCISSREQLIVPESYRDHPDRIISDAVTPPSVSSAPDSAVHLHSPSKGQHKSDKDLATGAVHNNGSGYKVGLDNITFCLDEDGYGRKLHCAEVYAVPTGIENDATISNHVMAAKMLMSPITQDASSWEVFSDDRQQLSPKRSLPPVEMKCYSLSLVDLKSSGDKRLTEGKNFESESAAVVSSGESGKDGLIEDEGFRRRKVFEAWVSLDNPSVESCDHQQNLQDLPKQPQSDYIIYVFGGRGVFDAPNIQIKSMPISCLDITCAQ
jgi:hypothetical protein